MRTVTAGGLAALIVMATMAFVVPTAASATTLCEEPAPGLTDECPAGKRYGPREYKAELEGEAVLKTFNAMGTQVSELRCKPATVKFETKATSGTPLPGALTRFELGTCTVCKLNKVLNLNYTLGIAAAFTGAKDGFITETSAGGGPGLLFESCGASLATCKYLASEEKVSVFFEGGAPARLALQETGTTQAIFKFSAGTSEALCGATLKIGSFYKVVEPGKVWVTAKP